MSLATEKVTMRHPADIAIFVVVIAVSIVIGLYYALTGDRQRTTKEYLLANRRLAVIPVALSMFMSHFSAIYILGQTAETYKYGVQTWLGMVGASIGYALISRVFVPLFYPLKVTSAFEYIEKRFRSRALHIAITICLIINLVTYNGVAMYAPGTALEAVTGFPLWASIVITGTATTIYTTLGGMKAVVWTDVFQGVVMIGGMLTVLIMGAVRLGGLQQVWQLSNDAGRINFFNFDPDPTTRMTLWPLIFGICFNTLSGVGTAQAYVQRYCALPTQRQANLALMWNLIFYLLFSFIIMISGLVLFGYYESLQCDPLRAGVLSNSNQLFPYFVLNVLPYPGLTGLLISVLYSGALSSVSSSLTSLSAVTWKDLLEPHFGYFPERKKALITKVIVFIYGCAGIGISFLTSVLPGHVMVVSNRLSGSLGSPIKGIMVLGCIFPFTNWKGAIVGSIVSLILTNWINIGAFLYGPHREFLNTSVTGCNFTANTTAIPMPSNPIGVFWLYRISFLWVGVIGSLSCIGVGLIVSCLTGKDDPAEYGPQLLIPICDRLFCCLPKSWRKFFWCGVDFDNVKMEDFKKRMEQNGTGNLMSPQTQQLIVRDYHDSSQKKPPMMEPFEGKGAGISELLPLHIHTPQNFIPEKDA